MQRVATYARHHPDAQVIIGHGWDERAWPEPMPPTRTELDRAAGGIAVYLARVDVHSAVVSSTLLDQLPGVSEASGYRPDGLLTREAHHLCRGSLDRLFTDQQRRSAARTALRAAAAQGVATVHELGGPHLGPIEDLTRVRDAATEVGMGSQATGASLPLSRPSSGRSELAWQAWRVISVSTAPSAREPHRCVSRTPMPRPAAPATCPSSRSPIT